MLVLTCQGTWHCNPEEMNTIFQRPEKLKSLPATLSAHVNPSKQWEYLANRP
jgi:hypothetical protein